MNTFCLAMVRYYSYNYNNYNIPNAIFPTASNYHTYIIDPSVQHDVQHDL